MGFFSFILFLVLLCWIATLQGKVDSLSATLKHVCRKVNDYEKIAFLSNKVEVEDSKSEVVQTQVVEHVESVQNIQVDSVENIQQCQVVDQAQNNCISANVDSQPKTFEQKLYEQQVQSNVREDFDIQKALLGNVFNKIGALAIIIAIIILIKLVSPFIVLTPLMKFVFGILLGAGFVVAGFSLHKKDNLKNYSEVLLGTGFATFFITTFCGYSVLNLYNSATAMVIGGALLFSTYLVADKMKTLSMLVIGLIGGYLTPLCAEAKPDQVFGFLIFLNAISAIYTLKCRKFNMINPINIFLTMFYVLCTYLFNPEPNIVFPVVLWGIYVLYDLLRDKSSIVDNVSSWINYAVLTFFSMIMFHNAHTTLGTLFAVTALIYLALAGCSRVAKNQLFKTYEYFVLLNVWLFIAFILNDVNSVLTWAIVALIVSVFVALFRLNYLVPAVVTYYTTAFIGAMLAHAGGEYCLIAKYLPIVNPRTLVFMVPVISMMFSSLLFRGTWAKASNWLRFMGLSMAYVYVIGEINSYLLRISESDDYINFCRLMIFTIIGFIYSLNAKKVANVTNSLLFNVASYVIFGITTFVLLISSYGYPDAYQVIFNLRCAAYVLAIISCLQFAKWDNLEIFKCIAVILGFFLCHSESAGVPKLYGSGWQYLISLAWVLYSGVTTIVGIVNNRRYLINTGIIMIILTIVRIFIYDLAKVDALYKLVAFLALGIILMLVSYIYTASKNKK